MDFKEMTRDELDALPVGSVILAHWEDGSNRDYQITRSAEGGAATGGFEIMSGRHWLGVADWGAVIAVLYTPSTPEPLPDLPQHEGARLKAKRKDGTDVGVPVVFERTGDGFWVTDRRWTGVYTDRELAAVYDIGETL